MLERVTTFATAQRNKLTALVAGLALFAAACGGGSDAAVVESAAAEPAPAESTASEQNDDAPSEPAPTEASLVASTIDGGQIDFGSLEGQDVVLWFWAPW
jgi:hypothetical protein